MKKLFTPLVCQCLFSILCIVFLGLKLGAVFMFWEMALIHVFLVILSFEDIKDRMISDKYIICILLSAFLFRIIAFEWIKLLNGAITGAVIGSVILLIRKVFKQNIGMGDLKLLAVLSISFGYAGMVSVLFYSVVLALLYGIFMMVLKKKNKNSEIPFVPFITIGSLLTVIGI